MGFSPKDVFILCIKKWKVLEDLGRFEESKFYFNNAKNLAKEIKIKGNYILDADDKCIRLNNKELNLLKYAISNWNVIESKSL